MATELNFDKEMLVSNIRQLCKDNNITVTKLESSLGFGSGVISRWNKSVPSFDKIVAIANYFRISISSIVDYQGKLKTKEELFLEKIIQNTINHNITWVDGKNIRSNYIKKERACGNDNSNRFYIGTDEINSKTLYFLDIEEGLFMNEPSGSINRSFDFYIKLNHGYSDVTHIYNEVQYQSWGKYQPSIFEELENCIKNTRHYGVEISKFIDSVLES